MALPLVPNTAIDRQALASAIIAIQTELSGMVAGTVAASKVVVADANKSVNGFKSLTANDPAGGVGYATGAGGAVTQATNRTTGVTLSKPCGQITTNNASLAAAAKAIFVVTNTLVAATDVVVAAIQSGGTGQPRVDVIGVAAGSFTLQVTNDHAATADTSADLINFAIIKAVAA